MTKLAFIAAGCCLLLGFSDSALAAGADDIERVEPPFWWQGFKHRELQLLVHGDNVSELSPSVDYAGVEIIRSERGDSPNYLFVYLDIGESADPGTFELEFTGPEQTLSYSYELREKNADPAYTKAFSSADVVYLITPDRFANGDEGNDSIDGYDDKLNRKDNYGRHGGDIRGILQHLDYISDMGFTQIWLNPILENAVSRASYHGYSTTDYYKVDPRFGSNESYREFVTAARGKGIGIIQDMIANHAGSGHWWSDDLPTSDWYNLPDSKTITSHARTTNQDPYASAFDKAAHANGWFVETMPDLNQRNPLLADYLIQNSLWWIEYVGLSGIRQDTYPYPDKHFMSEWTRRIMDEYPHFNIVGEEWSPSPAIVSYWQRGKKNHDGYESSLPSLMDFPLQIVMKQSLTDPEKPWGSVWTPVYEMLGHDFLYADPFNLMIFPDNHDMSRIYTQLDEDYALFRMATVFYLTMRGIPQVFYGTEILMSHPGTESHGALRMDFPGGWEGDRRNAFTGTGMSEKELDAQRFMRKLLNWRKNADVIHRGKLMQYSPIGNVYAYFRYNDDESVMVVFNRGKKARKLDLDRFHERLDPGQPAVDVLSGKSYVLSGSLEVGPRSVLLLEVKKK
ncbi:MAG: glycoside hydrolase family 13 protein [Gammaproteobacteria bacterium]|nr:glycoside hydrolase family 13 protein [Gammaproteobacteria bacterium]